MALGFERIRALVEKLANPQEELKTLQEIFRNRGKVVRLLIQKDADVLVLTRPKGERAADPSWVSEEICPLDGGGNTATVRVDVHDAYVAEMGGRARAVLVTGSLQTAAGSCAPYARVDTGLEALKSSTQGRRKHIFKTCIRYRSCERESRPSAS